MFKITLLTLAIYHPTRMSIALSWNTAVIQMLLGIWWFTICSTIGFSCRVRTCLKVWSVDRLALLLLLFGLLPLSLLTHKSPVIVAQKKKKEKKGFALKEMKCASCPTRRLLLWRHAGYQFGFWSRLLMLRGWSLTCRSFYFHFFFFWKLYRESGLCRFAADGWVHPSAQSLEYFKQRFRRSSGTNEIWIFFFKCMIYWIC